MERLYQLPGFQLTKTETRLDHRLLNTKQVSRVQISLTVQHQYHSFHSHVFLLLKICAKL